MPMDWEKWQQRKGPGPQPPDLDKVVDNLKRFKGRLPVSSLWLIVLVLVGLWAISGFYTVQQFQVGAVKRFGALTRMTEPGMNYHLPYPIESVTKVDVANIRRFEIGFRTVNPGPPAQYRSVDEEALMLTGDENIISIWFIVQYKINNASDFLFKVEDPEKTVKDAAEAAMREIIGDNKIDTALTVGKSEIQNDAQQTLQAILNKYESGMDVISVQLQEVHPPKPVQAAFKDVASAREDRNKYINQAEGYRNDILPKAKGEAAQVVYKAEAYKSEKVERAQGDASRFLSVLEEYRKAKDVTRKRLYLETLEGVYQRGKKFIIGSGNNGVLPLLPLQAADPLAQQPSK